MPANTTNKNISTKSIFINQNDSSEESHKPVTSIEKVELETKINISLMVNDIKPNYRHSQSISIRLNPTTSILPSSSSKETKPKNFKSEIYYNPKLEEKINQLKLKSLVDLSYYHLIDSDISIIVNKIINNKKCIELWLYGNKITSQGLSILALSLINNSILKSLDLSFNQISDIGIRSLTSVLLPNQNSSLNILYLSKNGISNSGIKYISEMLKINQTLTELWLSNNEIGNDGVKQLANALAYNNKTLKFLSLSMNMFITDISIDSIIEILEHNQILKTIWLSRCNLSVQGKKKLREKANQISTCKIEL